MRDASRKAGLLLATILLGAGGAGAVNAQGGAVDHVVAIAKPARYDGPCPASIEFIGTIFVNYPANVAYRWERSDHATGPVQTVWISGAGRGVVTRWQLSRPPGEMFSASETLHVLSPGDFYSNPAGFGLVCR